MPSLLSLVLLRNTWSSSPKSAVERSTPSPIADCTSETWGQLTFMLCLQEWLAIQITSLQRVYTNTLCQKKTRHDFETWNQTNPSNLWCFFVMAGYWIDPTMAVGEPVVWYPAIQSSDVQQFLPFQETRCWKSEFTRSRAHSCSLHKHVLRKGLKTWLSCH